MTSRTKQPDLPGVDREISELESKAMKYAAIRDQRQELTTKEVNLKAEIKAIMDKEKIEKYQHGKIDIRLVPEKIKVKVRVKNDVEDD